MTRCGLTLGVATLLGLWPSVADAATYVVPDDYSTVAAAAAVAVEGDSIEVRQGTYSDSGFFLRAGVVLRGLGDTEDVTLVTSYIVISAFFGGISEIETAIENMTVEDAPSAGSHLVDVRGVSNVRIQNTRLIGQRLIDSNSPIVMYDNELWTSEHSFETAIGFVATANSQPGPFVFYGNRALVRDNGVEINLLTPGLVTSVVFEHNTIVGAAWSGNNRFKFGIPAVVKNNIFDRVSFVLCPPVETTFTHNLFTAGANCVENMDPSNVIVTEESFCDYFGLDWRVEPGSPAIGAADDGGIVGALGVGCTVTGVEDYGVATAPGVTIRPNPARVGRGLDVLLEIEDASTSVTVFDVAGRVVRTLAVVGRLARWDGRGEHGGPTPAGVYYIRVSAERTTSTSKVVLMP